MTQWYSLVEKLDMVERREWGRSHRTKTKAGGRGSRGPDSVACVCDGGSVNSYEGVALNYHQLVAEQQSQ